jgi:hypothetical protein
LHALLVLVEAFLSFLAFFFLVLEICEQTFVFLAFLQLQIGLRRDEGQHPLIVSDFLQLLDQLLG